MKDCIVNARMEEDDDLDDHLHDLVDSDYHDNNFNKKIDGDEEDDDSKVSSTTKRKIETLEKALEQVSRDVWNYTAYEETATTISPTSMDDVDSDDLCQYLFCHDGVLIQRDLDERLQSIQNQFSTMFPQEITQPTAATSNNHHDQTMDTTTSSLELPNDDPDILFNKSHNNSSWKWKVSFLRLVTKARMAMEEVTSPATSSPNDDDILMSHSNTSTTITYDNIQQAQKFIQMAEQELQDFLDSSSSSSPSMEYEMAQRLLTSIRHQWQRLKVESITNFEKLWRDENLIIQSNQLSILSESSMKPIIYSIDKTEYAITLAQRIHTIVFQPIIDQHIEYCEKQFSMASTDSSIMEHMKPNTTWQMRETPKKLHKNNSTMLTLEWRQRTTNDHKTPTPPKSSTDNDNDSYYYDMQKTNNALESFLEVLQFVKHICQYCHDHFLLKQSDLSQIVGTIWYPKTSRSSPHKQSDELLQDDDQVLLNMNKPSNNFNRQQRVMQNKTNTTTFTKSSLQSQLLQLLWTTCLPRTNESAQVWNAVTHKWKQKLTAGILDLQTNLADCHFISIPKRNNESAKSNDWILMEFANQYERKHGKKQQSMILQRGRQLLLETDYHNTVSVGVDVTSTPNSNYNNNSSQQFKETKSNNDYFPEELDSMNIFLLHQCHVSQVVQSLMKLCRETMEMSVQSFAVVVAEKDLETLSFLPPLLYRTTRELLDLYRAIIPAAHGNEIYTIPRTAAIHYNDCVYLAHEMLTFGLEYRDRFAEANSNNSGNKKNSSSSNSVSTLGQLLPSLSTFVDLVPPFRELADRTMGNMIQRQKHILADIVQEKIGKNHNILASMFKCQEPVVEWSDAETALHAGIYHLQHLSKAWKPPILSHDVYGRVMGNLVDILFVLFLDPVQKAKDISEPACHFISSLFSNAIRNTTLLFEYNMNNLNTNEEEEEKAAERYCQIWAKFTAVGKFMDMSSLADIQFALSEGVFRSVTGPELSSLILAVFEDSDKRKHMLSLLGPEKN